MNGVSEIIHCAISYIRGYQLQDSFHLYITWRSLIFVIIFNSCWCISCILLCTWVARSCSLMNYLLIKKRENRMMPELLCASSHDKGKKFHGNSLLNVFFAFKNVFSSYFNLSIWSPANWMELYLLNISKQNKSVSKVLDLLCYYRDRNTGIWDEVSVSITGVSCIPNV